MTTLQLKHPFEVAGRTYSEITFRRPKTGDMPKMRELGEIEARREAGLSAEDQERASMLVAQIVTGLPLAVLSEIDLFEDFPALAEEAAGFLESIAPPAQPNGEQ